MNLTFAFLKKRDTKSLVSNKRQPDRKLKLLRADDSLHSFLFLSFLRSFQIQEFKTKKITTGSRRFQEITKPKKNRRLALPLNNELESC